MNSVDAIGIVVDFIEKNMILRFQKIHSRFTSSWVVDRYRGQMMVDIKTPCVSLRLLLPMCFDCELLPQMKVPKGLRRIHYVVVSNIFYFHPYFGKIPSLTNIFQIGWKHQQDTACKWILGSSKWVCLDLKIDLFKAARQQLDLYFIIFPSRGEYKIHIFQF